MKEEERREGGREGADADGGGHGGGSCYGRSKIKRVRKR